MTECNSEPIAAVLSLRCRASEPQPTVLCELPVWSWVHLVEANSCLAHRGMRGCIACSHGTATASWPDSDVSSHVFPRPVSVTSTMVFHVVFFLKGLLPKPHPTLLTCIATFPTHLILFDVIMRSITYTTSPACYSVQIFFSAPLCPNTLSLCCSQNFTFSGRRRDDTKVNDMQHSQISVCS
jgi:hypothetical protein